MILEKPQSEITVNVLDNKFTVQYPKSGQMIDIAVLKAKLSENQYSSLLYQTSIEAPLALRLIDVYSFLTIMVPKIKEALAKKSFYDLEAFEAVELVHMYDSQILPWLNKWTQYINNRLDELSGNNESDKSKLI